MIYYKKLFIFFVLFSVIFSSTVYAETVDQVKSKINDRNNAISKLEEEIKQYQIDIDALSKEKDSLSNNIKSLDISKKKLETDTKITENKIAAKNLEIQELISQISDKSERITDGKRVIIKSLTDIYQINSISIVENILSKKSFSDLWKGVDELNILQGSMQSKIKTLTGLKISLEENKKLTEKKKVELISLTKDLKNQASIIADTVKEKNSILSVTKSTESNYAKILAERKAQKDAYEREVLAFESALKLAIDPNNIPNTGKGVLNYPLDIVRITQYFGNTPFSTANPQAYKGQGHSGIDMGTSIGTPVKAALSGVVVGMGNTDIGRCRSYGKWIMVKHENGLSTLYAHLSLQKVNKGQQVSTGEIIAYSGNTGYSTGPHLHFGVYATEGVRIMGLSTSVNCKNIVIPYADLKAYLNPLSYL